MGIADCHFKETGMADKKTTQQASLQKIISTCDNPELQNALQIIQYTRRSLFLTGKAGTGKSTFLRYIAAHTKKKHIILAPTGIAAINAGGSTLHSFFKTSLPSAAAQRQYVQRAQYPQHPEVQLRED